MLSSLVGELSNWFLSKMLRCWRSVFNRHIGDLSFEFYETYSNFSLNFRHSQNSICLLARSSSAFFRIQLRYLHLHIIFGVPKSCIIRCFWFSRTFFCRIFSNSVVERPTRVYTILILWLNFRCLRYSKRNLSQSSQKIKYLLKNFS